MYLKNVMPQKINKCLFIFYFLPVLVCSFRTECGVDVDSDLEDFDAEKAALVLLELGVRTV